MSKNEATKIIISEYVMRFFYLESIQDATQMGAFYCKDKNNKNCEKKWLWNDKSLCDELTLKLSAFLQRIINLDYNKQEEYDTAFEKICNDICDIIKKEIQKKELKCCFTFGNAQKLVNIFLKYCFTITLGNIEHPECFKYCHCPMDNKMLNMVWNNYKKEIRDEKWNHDDFVASWGHPNYYKNTNQNNVKAFERYMLFQKLIRKECSNYTVGESGRKMYPIEYDYFMWRNNDK